MGLKCGIVGLPNVGKSTLFNALTKSEIEAQNYPFCTIEPNLGIVSVPDPTLQTISKIAGSQKTIPTIMEFVDIAGLVKGASQGEGLGNQFLSHIRSVDAIAHVVRCFEDENITHVEGQINPINDVETIETELALADIETLEKAKIKIQKLAKSGDKKALKDIETINSMVEQLNQTPSLIKMIESEENVLEMAKRYQLLTAKPFFYIANVPELDDLSTNRHYAALSEHAKSIQTDVIAVCASLEAELATMEEEEQRALLADMELDEPGLDKVIRESYKKLGLITFYTQGPKEARAWTVRKDSTAPKAAGCIHTDFEKTFIRAEVITAKDFIEVNGEQNAKAKGLWRLEGKDYIVKDGDILLIRAGA